MRVILKIFFACTAYLWMVTAHAQILIGQTTAVTGPVAASVKETTLGAQLYFNAVNAKGGINGEKIELITLDDGFDVKRAAENARVLVTQRNVVGMFLSRGTPQTQAILPVLQEYKIAMVGPSTGAAIFHQPVNPYIFNVRSAYQKEAIKSIEHLNTIGIARIAIIYVDDSFGKDVLEGASSGLKQQNMQAVLTQKIDREKPDYAVVIDSIIKTNAQAVLWAGTSTVVAQGVIALRQAGSAAQIITLSNNASSGFITALGDKSEGIVVSQVFPAERSVAYAMVREANDLAILAKITLSPAMLEGFAAAKVLVEGLRRAAPRITREKLRNALESINAYDIGGMKINYSATSHTGLDYVELSIIGRDGKFRR